MYFHVQYTNTGDGFSILNSQRLVGPPSSRQSSKSHRVKKRKQKNTAASSSVNPLILLRPISTRTRHPPTSQMKFLSQLLRGLAAILYPPVILAARRLMRREGVRVRRGEEGAERGGSQHAKWFDIGRRGRCAGVAGAIIRPPAD